MKIIVISYSLTGNNDDLAAGVAAQLEADHIRVTENKRRTMGTIVADLLFKRTPSVSFSTDSVEQYDLVLFIAPVWMGHVATPLRGCFKQLAPKIEKYAFASISGGADGPNPKLSEMLTKRMGKKPAAVIDLHIADLLPSEPKPERKDTSAYRIDENDKKKLADTIVAEISKITE